MVCVDLNLNVIHNTVLSAKCFSGSGMNLLFLTSGSQLS